MLQTFIVFSCWGSEFQALHKLDTSNNIMAIQSMKLEKEGWAMSEKEKQSTKNTVFCM